MASYEAEIGTVVGILGLSGSGLLPGIRLNHNNRVTGGFHCPRRIGCHQE